MYLSPCDLSMIMWMFLRSCWVLLAQQYSCSLELCQLCYRADSNIQPCQYYFCDQLSNIAVMFHWARWLCHVCHIPRYCSSAFVSLKKHVHFSLMIKGLYSLPAHEWFVTLRIVTSCWESSTLQLGWPRMMSFMPVNILTDCCHCSRLTPKR